MRIFQRLLISSAVWLAALCVAATAQLTLRSAGLVDGGAVASDGSSLIMGTIGQTIVGPVAMGDNLLSQGFWYTLPLSSTSGVRFDPVAAGSAVALHQNIPNPFSTTTEIAIDLPRSGYVSLKLFDAVGHEVQTLIDGVRDAGRITMTVSAGELESGYYTARLLADGATRTIAMVVVR